MLSIRQKEARVEALVGRRSRAVPVVHCRKFLLRSLDLRVLLLAILAILLLLLLLLLSIQVTVLELLLVLADLLLALLRQDCILELAAEARVFPLEELLVGRRRLHRKDVLPYVQAMIVTDKMDSLRHQ